MCKARLEIRILCEGRHRKEKEDRTKQPRSALIRKLARSGVEGVPGTRLDSLENYAATTPSNRHVGQTEACRVHLVLVRFNLIFVIEIEEPIEFEKSFYFQAHGRTECLLQAAASKRPRHERIRSHSGRHDRLHLRHAACSFQTYL